MSYFEAKMHQRSPVAVQWAAAFMFMPLLIFFCCGVGAYAAVTYNVFQWAGQPPKTAASRGGSGPPYNTWFLGPTWVTPKWHLETRSVHPFLHGSRVWPTDTHRERPRYSFCRNRPHLCYACDATQKQSKKPCSGKLGIGPDHPCCRTCRIKIKFCMEVVFRGSSVVSKCHQNRLSGFEMLGLKSALSHCFSCWIRA